MSAIQLHLEGAQADATAKDLEGFFEEVFGERPQQALPLAYATGEREKTDPVALTALILSLPGVIVQALDLAERIKLKDKVVRLIELARREWSGRQTRIWLQRPMASPLALDRAEPGEVLDALEKSQQQ
jgi:hypothetical protein